MTNPVYWLNGRCLPASQAVLHPNNHGIPYADGDFEGIRFYQQLTAVRQQRIEQQTPGAAAHPSLTTPGSSMDHV